MPPTLSLEDGDAATRKMREILLRHPEVITVVSQHGRPDNGSDASPFSNVELFVPLKPFDEWPAGLTKEKLTEQIQKEFDDELPGVGFNFSQYIQDNIEEALSGVKGANSVKIVGPNLAKLEKLADAGPGGDAPRCGASPISAFSRCWASRTSNIKVDRAKAARYGLNTGDVNTVVQAALGGAGRRPRCWKATGSSAWRCACAGRPRQHRDDQAHQGRLSDRQRRRTPICR